MNFRPLVGYSVGKLLDFRMASACSVQGCCNDTSKGSKGLCGKHWQRLKRHGDVNYVTPRDVWRQRCREKQLEVSPKAKPTTYKKMFQRHEHRVIAEKILGRALRPGEIVHHKDGNKHNNDPSNLEVMTQSQHIREHFFPESKQIKWKDQNLWLIDFAAQTGVPITVVRNRLRAGWSIDRIATTPVRQWTRRND